MSTRRHLPYPLFGGELRQERKRTTDWERDPRDCHAYGNPAEDSRGARWTILAGALD
jgi:hypothetical protein